MGLIFAAPEFAKVKWGDTHVTAFDLQTALNKARPGDVIQLTAGVYCDPVVMQTSGKAGAPIVLRGPDEGEALFDGGRTPEDGRYSARWMMDGHWAFLKMFDASHVRIENLNFQNCWPAVFYLRGCSDVALCTLKGTGARHVVFARNGTTRKTRRLLLQHIAWVQDPDHDMWEGRTKWKEVKEKPGFADKSWFNGALFESFDINGDVTICDCDISHAFNAIRMDIKEKRVKLAEGSLRVTRNQNVRIFRNRFAYIRDNAVEPEKGLQGWIVAQNLFFQVHAALSCDGVAIRDGAFVCNRFLNLSRARDGDHTGGKIIKFLDPSDEAPSPVCAGFVTAFNSIRTRTRYVADAKLKPWADVNNAVERFAATPRDDLALFDIVDWREGARTAGCVTNDPAFPTAYTQAGADVSGHCLAGRVFDSADPDPDGDMFVDGWDGDLPLSAEAQGVQSVAVTVSGPDGMQADIPAGQAVGYRPIADLGIEHWLCR